MPSMIKKIIISILTLEASILLSRQKPRIIAVSGSVGKTATKDAIFAALSPHVHIRKSEKSMNSEFGVPLTILGLESGWRNPLVWTHNLIIGAYRAWRSEKYPKWLVLEIGADRPGDIAAIAKWVKPDIVVLTHVPEIPVHVEFFDSPDAVMREKRSLVDHIRPGGTVIINGDDGRIKDSLAAWRGDLIMYGSEPHNHFVGEGNVIMYDEGKPIGISFNAVYEGAITPVHIFGSVGVPRMYAALAALAAAKVAGIAVREAAAALSAWTPTPGRMRLLDGPHGSIIIDDTYNSSPAAAIAALDTLADIESPRKIAILGDMMELGKYSADAHRNVGAHAAKIVDRLITVGIRSRQTGESALDNGLKERDVLEYEIDESRRAGQELREKLRKGDVVLVKGSQSMRMEKTVEILMAYPEKAKEQLVRQDEEWKSR